MRYLLVGSILLVSMFGIVSCSSNNAEAYLERQLDMRLRDFFDGKLVANGVVKNRSDNVFRHFSADIRASWDENGHGTLDETFHFDDGEIQNRIWTLVPNPDGSFLASANDVVGTAILKVVGNSIKMQYVLTVPYDDGTIDILVDDKMYLVSPNTIINESAMSKFGIKVGSVALSIVKQ